MEVTFKRCKVARNPDVRTFRCESISERPTEYLYDKANDGGVELSRMQRPVIVKAINLAEFRTLGWEPTHVEYEDTATGQKKELGLYGGYRIIEPDTLVFDIQYVSSAA
jgi:hypothetical protein